MICSFKVVETLELYIKMYVVLIHKNHFFIIIYDNTIFLNYYKKFKGDSIRNNNREMV